MNAVATLGNSWVQQYQSAVHCGTFVGTEHEWLRQEKANRKGWLWVSDTKYSEDNPMRVQEGVNTQLSIDGVRRLDRTAPVDSKYWWDPNDSSFYPTAIDEVYQLDLNFFVRAKQTNKAVIVELTNRTLGALKSKSYALIRDPGTIERVSFDYSVIITPNLAESGIQFEITANTDIEVWKTSLQILRVFKP